MTTVFGKQGNDFYAAFYEPDPGKRRIALDEWVRSATPGIQAAVSEELKAFVEWVTQGRWNEAGWNEGNEKLHRIQNDYPLVMDIKLQKLSGKYLGELPERVVYKPATPAIAPAPQNPSPVSSEQKSAEDYDDDDGGDDGGRSSNDDRSDSMNPNNDAYWSSRG